jgi:hypothetical protein
MPKKMQKIMSLTLNDIGERDCIRVQKHFNFLTTQDAIRYIIGKYLKENTDKIQNLETQKNN